MSECDRECFENDLLTVDMKHLRKLTGLRVFNRAVLLFHWNVHVVHLGQKRRQWEHNRYVAWDTEGGERTDLPLEDGSAKLSILSVPSIERSGAVMIS